MFSASLCLCVSHICADVFHFFVSFPPPAFGESSYLFGRLCVCVFCRCFLFLFLAFLCLCVSQYTSVQVFEVEIDMEKNVFLCRSWFVRVCAGLFQPIFSVFFVTLFSKQTGGKGFVGTTALTVYVYEYVYVYIYV